MKITINLTLLILILPLYIVAQCPSRPVASFRLNDNDICFGQSITVVNTSNENGNDVYYVWEWGDGTQDIVQDNRGVTHKYDQPINFCAEASAAGGFARDITLRMVNRNAQCLGHASKSEIFIFATPQTNFTFDDVCISNPVVKFKNTTCPLDNRYTFEWDFGDPASGANNTSGAENPTHTYPRIGSYTVKLKVTGFCGAFTISKQIRVLDPPQASATYSKLPVYCAPYELRIINTSINGTLHRWKITPDTGWAYTTGYDSYSGSPIVRFNSVGDYKMILTASSPCGIDSKWETNTISVRQKPKIALDSINGICIPFAFKPVPKLIYSGGETPQYLWTFNNGGQTTTSTNFDPGTINFVSPGNSSVQFKASNGCGDTTITQNMQLTGTLNISFPNVRTQLCDIDSFVVLRGTPAGGTWSGRGITSSGIVSPKNLGTGDYTFNYSIIQGTCRDNQDITIKVIGNKVLAGEIQEVCNSNQSRLILRGGTPAGGTWSGRGVIDSINGIFDPSLVRVGETSVIYTYRDAGSGCPNDDAKNITVNAAPKAILDIINLGVCSNANKLFTHKSQGAIEYKWYFGDGDSSSLENPFRAYQLPGQYDLTLIAKSFRGCSDTTNQKVSVITAPKIGFAINKKEGCTPLNVALNNTTQGAGIAYLWDFGNGSTSSQTQPGQVTLINNSDRDTTYKIVLNAIVAGCSNIKDSVVVTVVAPPKASFGLDVEKGCSPLKVKFNNLSTGSPRNFAWDFRNGGTTTDAIPTVQSFLTDSVAREYSIKLVASNICRSDSIEKKITVNSSFLRPLFAVNQDRGCEPLTVNFTNYAATGTTVTYDFGDGNRYTNPNPTYNFEKAGIYTVTQYASGICGADSVKKVITVYPTPSAKFTYQQFDSCHDYRVKFKSNISQDVNIVWDFGDSTQNGQNNPIHNFRKAGLYKTTLKVQGIGTTCTAADSTIVEVKSPLKFKIDSIVNSKCYGVNSGAIVIRRGDVTGGALKYQFSLNDSTFKEVNTSGVFSNLKGREYYTVWVRDTAGCTDTAQVFINGRLPLNIDAGPMREVELGDSLLIFIQGNVREKLKVKWEPEVGVTCPTCEQTFIKPKISTIYRIDATDALGCTERTFLTVAVNKVVKIFVPNTFSPNDDGFNDVFSPHTGLSVQRVKYLRIFNRWGEMVYQAQNFEPNDRNIFWDGRHRGKSLEPQVLVYVMEVELVDGAIELVKGDVTVVK